MAANVTPSPSPAREHLVERITGHSRSRPEATALVWVDAGGSDQRSCTYAELDSSARSLACTLLGEGIRRGDTVALVYTPGLDFHVAFWACLLAGIVAVPLNPPYRKSDVPKFRAIMEDCGAQVALTDRLFARLLATKTGTEKVAELGRGIATLFGRRRRSSSSAGYKDLARYRWITSSEPGAAPGTHELRPQPPGAAAFLMYTSGSTSAPKGVLASWDNIEHQCAMVGAVMGSSRDHVACWWAPHFHDFGLVSGLLNVLYQGAKGVICSPMHFIQRPSLWLDMMHAHRVTHTFGPDFGYRLLVTKTSPEERAAGRWDLTELKVAMSAAEKVRYSTLEYFAEAFAPCGFRRRAFCPAFGLAENTVGVTINGPEQEPRTMVVRREALEYDGTVVAATAEDGEDAGADRGRFKQMVGSGVPAPDTMLRIVALDEEGEPLALAPADQVGEIWVASRSVTLGYHRQEELTAEVFRARLPGVAPGQEGAGLDFLRTGDLGFLSSRDGDLYVCGRIKDMVIVAGKNHYSEDMELSIAEELQGVLRAGRIATFAMDEEDLGHEELCVVAEVRTSELDRADCFERVRACIARENHVDVAKIVLITPGSVPKTTSGKIRRFVVHDQMLADQLDVIPDGVWVRERSQAPAPRTEAPEPPRESDFQKLLLDFRAFVSSRGSPAAFEVHFPECGEGFTDWHFLVGLENLALMFDEEKFSRMPVWNFTAPAPELFSASNFPRWANGEVHRHMKGRLADIIDELTPTTVERTIATTDRFLARWSERGSFEWLPEFNEFTTALFCEVFTGRCLPQATEQFTSVLYGVDPFRKHSFERLQVEREDSVEQGQRAKQALSASILGADGSGGDQLHADLLIGAGGFAVIPALKNLLINLYAQVSSQPEVRLRLYEELRALPRPLAQEQLESSTPYLQACILETVRLFPPVGHYYARARQDMLVCGQRIPAGANVVGHTWYSYRDPRFFAQPERFDPERFLPPREEQSGPGHAFEPFGSGDPLQGHACPGRELALLIAKAVMARSLLEYDWELARPAWDDTSYRERYGVPNFEDGMRVRRFQKRTAGAPSRRAPRSWRVAVVGAGASGLAAAHALTEYGYRVTLYESQATPGGHACTKQVEGQARQPAFGVFMEKQWPNACALMRELGVEPIFEARATEAVRHFARDGHALPLESVQREATRFYYDMTRVVGDPEADGVSIGEFFEREEYSQEFICHYFIGVVIHYFAGHTLEYYLGYPLRLVAWMYLGNTFHGEEAVLRVDNASYVRALVDRLVARGVEIHTGVDVELRARNAEGVELVCGDERERYGHLVLALQPQHALRVLGGCASPAETDLLSRFEYTTDTVVAHFDDSWLPRERSARGVLNFMLPDKGEPLPGPTDTIPVTTSFPSEADAANPVYCTYDYGRAQSWEGRGPHRTFAFEHLRITPSTQSLRRELRALQGQAGVHYCGSWSRGLSLHEDAVVTGIQAANRIMGPGRHYPLLPAALALAAPFERSEDSLGTSVQEVIDELAAILRELVDFEGSLEADTDLLSLGLSSLDVGRLVNAVNARSSGAGVAAEEIYALDTLQEVAEHILAAQEGVEPEREGAPVLAAGAALEEGAEAPLSLTQAPILESHLASGQASAHWNIAMRSWLHGELDAELLRRSMQEVAARQAVLRTRFVQGPDAGLLQRIEAELPADYFETSEATERAAATQLALEASLRPLDVSRSAVRVHLIRVQPELSLLVVVLHHAIADGWSVGVLARELWEHYAALRDGRALDAERLPALPVQFVDHARWQQELEDGGHHEPRLQHWRERLSSPLPYLSLSEARLGSADTRARALHFRLTPAQVERLQDCARDRRTSLNVVILTAYALALGERAEQQALLVQVPVAGRVAATEALIGCFADALILELGLRPGADFAEHVEHAHRQLHDAVRHAVPLSVLLRGLESPPAEKLKLHRAVLHWEQTLSLRGQGEIPGGGLRAERFEPREEEPAEIAAHTHSVLNINQRDDGSMQAEWLFNQAAIPAEDMHALVARFQAIVEREASPGSDGIAPFAASDVFGAGP